MDIDAVPDFLRVRTLAFKFQKPGMSLGEAAALAIRNASPAELDATFAGGAERQPRSERDVEMLHAMSLEDAFALSDVCMRLMAKRNPAGFANALRIKGYPRDMVYRSVAALAASV